VYYEGEKSRAVRWVKNIERMGYKIYEYEILVGKPYEKK
jgi:hypothetical protein